MRSASPADFAAVSDVEAEAEEVAAGGSEGGAAGSFAGGGSGGNECGAAGAPEDEELCDFVCWLFIACQLDLAAVGCCSTVDIANLLVGGPGEDFLAAWTALLVAGLRFAGGHFGMATALGVPPGVPRGVPASGLPPGDF